MKLTDFIETVDPKILERGRDYYMNGHITKAEKTLDGLYIFAVTGKETYTVTVTLHSDEETIARAACTCPYKKGGYCKHQAAAFYFLSDEQSPRGAAFDTPQAEALLKNMDKKELIQLLSDLLIRYPSERNRLILSQTDYTDGRTAKQIQGTIQEIISCYKGPRGYINYYDTMELSHELTGLLDGLTHFENTPAKLDLLLDFHTQSLKLIPQADDSSGAIGDLLMLIRHEIKDTLAKLSFSSAEDQQEALKHLEQTLKEGMYLTHVEQAVCLLKAWTPFVKDQMSKGAYLALIDRQLQQLNGREERYFGSQLLLTQAEILKAHDSKDDYIAFMEKHAGREEIRLELLTFLLSNDDCLNIIEVIDPDPNRPFLDQVDTETARILYATYERLGQTDRQIALGTELLLDGDIDYYDKVKPLVFDPDAFYREIKEKLKERSVDIAILLTYTKLLKKEQDHDSLLQLTRDNPYLIESVVDLLKGDYEEETRLVYVEYLQEEAKRAGNRKDYRQVRKKLKAYGERYGKEERTALVRQLKKRYKRKAAFLEELNRLK